MKLPPKILKQERESTILGNVQFRLNSIPGIRLFRNNCGILPGENGRAVRFGLAPGSGDLIGWIDGRFVSFEIKRPGKSATAHQVQWAAIVRSGGGFACTVTSVAEALDSVETCREEMGHGL